MSIKTSASSIAEIDLRALETNLHQVEKYVGNKEILAVVKADAYGHGAVQVSQYLSKSKRHITLFGVAFLEEGIALREAGINDPILLLTGCPEEQASEIVQYRLSPVVYDLCSLSVLSRQAVKLERKVHIHVKVDTGMGRLGLPPAEVLSFIEAANQLEGIEIEGILSHFAYADLKEQAFSIKQLEAIKNTIAVLDKNGIKIRYCHMANSAAVFHLAPAHLNLVRPGLMLYGYSSVEEKTPLALQPIMQIKSRVLAIKKVSAGTSISYGRTFIAQRESLIATVGIGYADGYSCALSNRGIMIAQGQPVPVAGRVCMDMTMIDVTEVPSLKVGDWVTVIGAEGGQSIWADRVAKWAMTHPYEVLCGIGPRVKRIYLTV